jgi:hypothetical protein
VSNGGAIAAAWARGERRLRELTPTSMERRSSGGVISLVS